MLVVMEKFQNIFNRDFYPTPEHVVDMMISTSDVRGKVVLEPSFGKCNIVRRLNDLGAEEVIGCEINDTLRGSAQGVRVIGDDFFNVTREQVSHIDMIVMNPPFSEQKRHISHAWDIAPDGCEIISLCNAGMFGRWSPQHDQTLIDTIETYGYYDELGDVFSDSEERKTDCEVACIHLFKPGSGDSEFAGFLSFEPDEEQPQGDGIVTYNEVREAVNRYVAAVSMWDSVMEGNSKINAVIGELSFGDIKFGAFWCGYGKDKYTAITRETFKKELQKHAWRWVFAKFDMQRFLTRSVYEQLNKAVEKMSHMPFTVRNVYRMIDMIIQTHSQRLDNVIIDAFERICKYSDDNVTYHGEKWKTNAAHMVNKRFIIPYICDYDTRYPSLCQHVRVNYSDSADLDDLNKALCYISGIPYEERWTDANGREQVRRMKSLDAFTRDIDMKWGEWYDWGFFRIKGFKKRTMHFEFQSEELWYKFNQRVAQIKGWGLPVNTKAKKTAKKGQMVIFDEAD